MRNYRQDKALLKLLEREDVLEVADFVAVFPGIPLATVFSRIRSLLKTGAISQIGKGRYVSVCKPPVQPAITAWMKQVNDFLTDRCEGVDHCIREKDGNLSVEVGRGEILRVQACLEEVFPKVALQRDADRFPASLDGYILVGRLVTDAPVIDGGGISVPALEKMLVDDLCHHGENRNDVRMEFQRALEVYSVNLNRLHRYASRRGVSEELSRCLSSLNPERVDLFSRIQRYFMGTPVEKAWVFGSFARGEETEQSDLDLLVEYDSKENVSLLDMVRQRLDLEKIAGRSVDLVENGYLKPFAVSSAERDKYLIYAR